MTNAVCDLSNLFFRSLFIVGGYGSKKYTFDSQSELNQLMRKVSTDISAIIRTINASRVIFALDSRPWRKDISIDENEGYKGNRKKSVQINWDNVYEIMNDLADILKNKGFIVSKIDNAEADDIMALWKDELLYKQNQHIILVSADEDVRQLVDTKIISTDKKAFSVVFNPFTMGKNASKKIFAPIGFNEWIMNDDDIGDIFNRSIDIDKDDFKRILNDKTIIEEISGREIALKKIFCGDDGDNIPSIFSWLNESGKKVRITESKYRKIIDNAGILEWQDLLLKKDIIYNQIRDISGQEPTFNIDDRLDRQIKLTVLNASLFPSSIIDKFNKHIKDVSGQNNINPQSYNMSSLLDGTKYINSKTEISNGNESSIFSQIDKITNKHLF